jgi:peptide/nickel transport system substrate-binding protein
LAVFDRNPDWDAASDPLRKAWVDRIQVTLAVPDRTIQRAIDPEEADLSLDSHVPQTQIATLRTDPARSGGCRSTPRGACGSWFLGRTGGAGAIADVRVRRAINYAVDKVAYRDAIAGRFAHRRAGLHHPATRCARPPPIRPLPESGQPGDPAKARALLAEAGYPNVRDRPLVCPAGQTTDELGGQCPG